MLLLDNDYIRLGQMLKAECQRKSIPFGMDDLNKQGLGDLVWLNKNNEVESYEIKSQAEAVGDLDHLEKQLQSQAANATRIGLLIYGPPSEMAPDGNIYTYSVEGDEEQWSAGVDAGLWRKLKRRYSRQSYLGYRTKLARFSSDFGIEVYELPGLPALTQQIIALYTVATTTGKTFSRYIKERVYIEETDPERKRMILSLISLSGANIGEETADAITTWLESVGNLNMASLIRVLPEMGDLLAKQKLRSGKRTVGNATVARLMDALGVSRQEIGI
jgi:hypothetical protein